MTHPGRKEHNRIWLEPAGAPDRCWCQDNQWGEDGVEYILASDAQSRIRSLEEENSNLRKAIQRLVDVYGDMQDGDGEPCPDIAAARLLVQSKSTEEIK